LVLDAERRADSAENEVMKRRNKWHSLIGPDSDGPTMLHWNAKHPYMHRH